jgi:hypothetical protein
MATNFWQMQWGNEWVIGMKKHERILVGRGGAPVSVSATHV